MFKQIKRIFYFLILFVIPVLLSFSRKFESVSEIKFISLLDDMVLIVAFPLACRGFTCLIKKKYSFCIIFLFSLYLMMGLISGIIHSIHIKQMLFQFALEMKYPLILCIMYGLPDKFWFVQRFFDFSKLILLLSIPIIIWQFFDPSSYHFFFLTGGDKGSLLLPNGILLQRSSGVLWATGQFAMFCGISLIYFFFNYLQEKSYRSLSWALISFFLLLSSFSRLEITGTIFGIWIALVLSQKGTQRIISYVVILMLLIPAASFLTQLFLLAYDRLELNNVYLSQAARVVFYYYSVVIATRYFPFGSGLGTYGGYSAVTHDSEIYYLLNFHGYEWFRNRYMTDTFWPHILGEAGIFGIIFYIGSLFYLWKTVVFYIKSPLETMENNEKSIIITRSSVAVLTLVYINSLATPIFYSVLTLMPCLLLIASISGNSIKMIPPNNMRYVFSK